MSQLELVEEISSIRSPSDQDYYQQKSDRDRGGSARRNSLEHNSSGPAKLGTKRGLVMALGLGVVLMVLVISTAVLVSNSKGFKDPFDDQLFNQFKNETVTLHDVLTARFSASGFNGTFTGGKAGPLVQYMNRAGDLLALNASTNVIKILIASEEFMNGLNGLRPFQVVISPDRLYALVASNYRKIYRYSFLADYDIYNFARKTFEPILPTHMIDNDRGLQLAQWSTKGSAFAYVFKNNIYYRAGAEADSLEVQLTTDGNDFIYNGVADWVYEEEMLGATSAIWFSLEGSNLAYAQFNDSKVDVMRFPLYEIPGGGGPSQYPWFHSVPYPKAGRDNPSVSMFYVQLPTMKKPASFTKPVMINRQIPINYYLGTSFWANDHELGVVTLNRAQNDEKIYICNSGAVCTAISGEIENQGWIDMSTPIPSKDGQEFITITSQKQNVHTYKHILKFDRNNNRKPITAGNYFVDSILSWDHDKNLIYYTGTRHNGGSLVGDPRQSHLYRIKDNGENPIEPECLTCSAKNSYGEDCLSNSVSLSDDNKYFTLSCNGPNVPEITIRSTDTPNVPDIMWNSNQDLRNRLEFVALPKILYFNVPLASGFTAKAKVMVPHDYDSNKKYPILVDVYGGPGSQKITTRYGVDWGTSLVSSFNILYASIDGRGSGRQSNDLLFQVYRRLGTVEIADQIAGLKWLIKNMGSIDPEKTAIWGWSYGGFATAMVMGGTDDTYKCGVSVAPVTNWAFYDTIYTERYMGEPTPDDNYEGYNASDVSNLVINFKNKNFYLLHGNGDDNVHYQQSMVLSRALEKNDILFRQQSYPDQDHGIAETRPHLYHSIEHFLCNDCFKMNCIPQRKK